MIGLNDDPYADVPPPDEPPDEIRPPERATGLSAQLLDRADLANLPKPSPLIEDTLDLGTVAVLAGYWGTCKSFLAQDWGACVATGKGWQARSVEQRRVLYIAAEGAYGLHDRLTAWETGWRHTIDPPTFHTLPVRLNVGKWGDVAQVCAIVDNLGFGLVIVDTLAKCMVGMDENSAQDMGTAVDALYRIRDATNGGTVLAVHHTGKDKSTIRGSSALEAGVDTVYTVDGDPENLKVERTKRKEGPTQDLLQLKLDRVAYTDSAVLVSALGADISGRARDLLSVFVSAFSETGASKSDLRAAADMASATFHRALNTLVREGALVNHGSETRPFYKAANS